MNAGSRAPDHYRHRHQHHKNKFILLKKLPIRVAFFVFKCIEVFLRSQNIALISRVLNDKRLGKLCNAYDNAKDQEMKTMWSIKMTELYKIYIDSRPRNGTYH